MAERLNDKNFEQKALQNDKLALIDFYSDSCVPCKRMSPILAELEEVYAGSLFVGKVNIAYETELVERYQVQTTPTFLLIRQGEVADRFSGAVKKAELEEKIKLLL